MTVLAAQWLLALPNNYAYIMFTFCSERATKPCRNNKSWAIGNILCKFYETHIQTRIMHLTAMWKINHYKIDVIKKEQSVKEI